jgi:maltose alpha-D-glucosyltransferase/alpha-amylase
MGASGFRVDMAGWCVKLDPDYGENIRLWQEMRAWLEGSYPEAVLVSEWGRPRIAIQAGFHIDFTLPFGMPGYTSLLRKPTGAGGGSDRYGFSFFDRRGHGNIQEFLDDYLPHYLGTREHGLIAPITGNHDINPRLGNGRSTADLELIYTWLLTMPGVPFIYYGDEIGMRTLDGLPSKEGGYDRTGSRTPMQWADTPNAGFSTAPAEALYLPVDTVPGRPTVAGQESDPASLLNQVRKLIALRRAHPALCASGVFEVLYAEAGKLPWVYRRSKGSEIILVALNPAERPAQVQLPVDSPYSGTIQTLHGWENALTHTENGWLIQLPGVSGGVYLLKDEG